MLSDDMIANLGLTKALAIEILEMFEDVLDAHHIYVPDDDRTGDDGEACLYGCTYGNLEDDICALLSEYIKE